MSDEMNFGPNYIVLTDDEGNEQEFEFFDALDYEGEEYVALIPVIEDSEEFLEDDGKFVVLKSMEDDGEEILVTIDDDEEYEKIGNMFIQRAEEMMAMMDDEDEDVFETDLEDGEL